MLNKVKLLLGLTDNTKDDLLTLLIENAIEEVRLFTHNDCIADLEGIICRVVVWQYNRLGTEGVNTEGFSGVSYSYADEYPESILRSMRAKRKIQVV